MAAARDRVLLRLFRGAPVTGATSASALGALGALGAPRSGGGGVMGKDPEQHISSNPMLHRRCCSIFTVFLLASRQRGKIL